METGETAADGQSSALRASDLPPLNTHKHTSSCTKDHIEKEGGTKSANQLSLKPDA